MEDFRELLDKWTIWEEKSSPKSKIDEIIENNDIIMFFTTKDNKIYGAPEESRIIFARMKDNDIPDYADFVAYNLEIALKGKGKQKIFTKKDLENIHIIPKNEAIDKLLNL